MFQTKSILIALSLLTIGTVHAASKKAAKPAQPQEYLLNANARNFSLADCTVNIKTETSMGKVYYLAYLTARGGGTAENIASSEVCLSEKEAKAAGKVLLVQAQAYRNCK